MFLMRLFFWKQSSKKSRKTTICTLYVYSRFFYFVKLLNLPALSTDLVFSFSSMYDIYKRYKKGTVTAIPFFNA